MFEKVKEIPVGKGGFGEKVWDIDPLLTDLKKFKKGDVLQAKEIEVYKKVYIGKGDPQHKGFTIKAKLEKYRNGTAIKVAQRSIKEEDYLFITILTDPSDWDKPLPETPKAEKETPKDETPKAETPTTPPTPPEPAKPTTPKSDDKKKPKK